MTDEEYYQKLKELLPFAQGQSAEEMMQSQAELMIAQQKAYVENKELFDRLWAEGLQNDPMEVKRQEIEKRGELQALERFRAWCDTAGPWHDSGK
jgi:predicted Ser/Thr protein kinase